MSDTDKNPVEHEKPDHTRRRLLGLLGLAATAAYVAPTMLSLDEAAASTPSGGNRSGGNRSGGRSGRRRPKPRRPRRVRARRRRNRRRNRRGSRS